ncbi:2-dehydro-3-deoxygalactonokinase [Telmatospirillum siberiense]|uniref:2-keto-3-deoxy-galactonokinase n=1 Tax=Telmatospirillum siberiense TaxID=382514 RepID=A0A2N3PYW2_9PROT|nr:2-dehydro-3-deoxygalactonokinase [Telmatospirillum siberiense]PKU25614.1 2-keto-3-deoxy-galactonokinase [Telmatospirillum siberiense]
MSASARLIALDWGTSSLRAYLLGDGGAVLDEVSLPWGIMATPDGDFAKALETATAPWRRVHPDLPMIAAGMIGSAQGWRQVPYVSCPAGPSELAADIGRQAADPNIPLPIVPGVSIDGDIPDVMRGEETQVLGALHLAPHLFHRSLLVMPGTHSKWVSVQDGAITDFTTYLTGELFAVLARHSILGRPAIEAARDVPPANAPVSWDSFERGVRMVRDTPSRGLSSLLFSARTLVLAGRLAPSDSLDYLSGLVIGEELRGALAPRKAGDGGPLALIGEKTLCERYRRALVLFGIAEAPIIAGASAAGLWRIAAQSFPHVACA